jgi:ATP-binding cassette subfamily F protein uup
LFISEFFLGWGVNLLGLFSFGFCLSTLELLEEMLVDYTGTLILISHDRTFLNNVVGSTVVMEGDGIIEQYAGGYDDYLLQKQDTLNKTGKTKTKTHNSALSRLPNERDG